MVASLTDDGVTIRDAGLEPRRDHIQEFSLVNMEVHDAFIAAERAVNPSIPNVGGMVGSNPAGSIRATCSSRATVRECSQGRRVPRRDPQRDSSGIPRHRMGVGQISAPNGSV